MYSSFRRVMSDVKRHPALYFSGLLTEEHIQAAFGSARSLSKSWLYTPLMTITVFLAQCLSPDHSCRDASALCFDNQLVHGSVVGA